jgi:hypothetical protein
VKRQVFNVLTALSLLLCVFVIGLWTYSYRPISTPPSADGAWHAVSVSGKLVISQAFHVPTHAPPDWTFYSPGGKNWPETSLDRSLLEITWHEDGLDTMWDFGGGVTGTRSLTVPFWLLALILSIAPVFAICRRIASASRATNEPTCVRCGYDLRGTPDRCPECGAVPAASRGEDSPSKSTADEPVHCRGVPTSNERQVVDYASQRNNSSRQVPRIALRVFVWVIIAAVAFALPVPKGIWYFGPHSQWLVAVEWSGLTIGSSTSTTSLGWLPLIAIKLTVLSLPLWLVQRARRRKISGAAHGV